MQLKKTTFLLPEWIAAYLITAASIVMQFYYWLHVGSLWRDEVNLVNLSASHSLLDMERDAFPLVMPLMVHFWLVSGLGHNDLGLRFLGLLVGLGILAALWISGWKTRRAPPLCGLVLVGLNSTMIFFGDSLRAYGLGSLCAAALTGAAFAFLQNPTRMRMLWLALFAVLSVQVLYHNVVVVAAISFGAWAVCWRRGNWRVAGQILLIAVLAAVSLLPYMHIFVSSGAAGEVFRTGVKMVRFTASYLDTLDFPIQGFIYVWCFIMAAIIIRAVVALRQETAKPAPGEFSEGDLNIFAAVALILLAVGFPFFFWRAQMPMQSWYLLPLMASAVVCFDATLPVFRGLVRPVFLGFAVGTAVASIFSTAGILNRHFSDIAFYARRLAADAGPQDYIVVAPWTCGITFNYYDKAPAAWDTLPPLSDHATHRVDLVLAQMENPDALAPVFQKISRALESGHQVWFLTAVGQDIPAPGTPALRPLPPPPLKYSGWSESPYSGVWASQTIHFIADHSLEFKPYKLSSKDGFITETMDLLVADGWRTNTVVH